MSDSYNVVRTLLRDERAVAEALEFDLGTAGDLRARLDDLLETISVIGHDDDLWNRMADAAESGPMTPAQFDRLTEVTTMALPVLLANFGYRCPPPPPAGELVDDTIAALGAALAADGDRVELVREARWYFLTMSMRIDRQLERAPAAAKPSTLRRCARQAGTDARDLVPAVLGSGMRKGIELTAIPVVSPVLGEFAGNLVKISAERIIGWWSRHKERSSAPSDDRATPPPTGRDPLVTHLGAVIHHIGQARANAQLLDRMLSTEGEIPESLLATYREQAVTLTRHVRRLDQLRADRHPDDLRLGVACTRLVEAAAAMREPHAFTGEPGCAAAAADRVAPEAIRVKDALERAGHDCGGSL